MRLLPVVPAVRRTAEERVARGVALRRVLGPVEGWSEDERFELAERVAVFEVDGVVDAERVALEVVRADLLRRAR